MGGYQFKRLAEMQLIHLPNDAKLLIQQQTSDIIPDDVVQLYLATTFINPDNKQPVFNKGFSVQLDQLPEMVDVLQRIYEKYSGKKLPAPKPSIVTFVAAAEEEDSDNP